MKPKKSTAEVVAECGGATALANFLGAPVKRQNVEYWIRVDEIPSAHCPAIERQFGMRCEELRPTLKWVRVPDDAWKRGKPLLDPTPPVVAESAQGA